MKTERDYYDVDLNGSGVFTAAVMERRPFNGKTALILDKTPFYPEGGGQPCDLGTINGRPLVEVREEKGEILHILDADAGLDEAAGGEMSVPLKLDLVRRRDLTVQHTAQHLLSGITLKLTGLPTVSMHLGEKYTTIDVDGKDIGDETLARLEDEVMRAIEEDTPVITHLCPPENIADFPLRKRPPQDEEVIRVVEIRGRDFSPCCGTHLKSAGMIGMLRIIGAEKHKGMTRFFFIAGRRCFEDSRMLRTNAECISRALSVPIEETGKAALGLLEKTAALEEKLKAFMEEAAGERARAIVAKAALEKAGGDTWYAEYLPDAAMEEAVRLGKRLQELSGAVFVLGAGRNGKFAALCSEKGCDIRPRLKELLEKTGGRGGGGADFFQGVFPSDEALKTFLAAFQGTA